MLAREFGTDYSSVVGGMNGKWVEKTDTTGLVSLAYVAEIVRSGQMAPVEYCTPMIKDMIISARKQTLIMTLEQDLLNDARKTGQLVIID